MILLGILQSQSDFLGSCIYSYYELSSDLSDLKIIINKLTRVTQSQYPQAVFVLL